MGMVGGEETAAMARAEREREAHLRLVAGQAPAVLWSTDAELRFTSSLGAGQAAMGLRPQQVVGLSLFGFFRTDDPAHPSIAAHRRALDGESVAYEQPWAGRVFRVHVEPLRDPAGAIVGTVGLALDVTEREEAAEALRANERRLRALHAASERQARDLALLDRMRSTLARELDLSTLFRTAVEATAQTFGCSQASLYLREGDHLVLRHQVGHDRVIDRFPVTDGISGRVVRTGLPVLLEDVRTDPAFLGAIDGIVSEVCVPLRDQDRVVGTLNLESTGGVRLTDADLRLMVALTEHVNVAIGRARLFGEAREREERLRLALAAANMATWDWNLETGDIVRSEGMAALFGLNADAGDAGLDDYVARVHPDDRHLVAEMDRRHLQGGADYDVEYRIPVPDGRLRWLREKARLVRDARGRPVRLLGVTMDVTERKEADEALRRSEARFRSLVQRAADMISVLDADGIRTYASPAYTSALGYRPDELVGRHAAAIDHPDDAPRTREFFAELARRPGAVDRLEARVRHRDGSERWLEVVASNRLDDPGVGGIVINSRDVTERKALEERLRHQAFHDPLTGLPNRALFLDLLAQALDRARHRRRRPPAVPILFLDLDGFKVVNDSLGHALGDRLLVAAAGRLAAALRAGDLLARFGGDEFAVLLQHAVSADEATRVAERLLAVLAPPFVLDGDEAVVGASVGVVVSAPDLSDPADLLRAADVALYRAKAAGKGAVAVFDPGTDKPARGRLARETALRRALERGELRVAYQPVVRLATGAVEGVEALVRWADPARGLLGAEEIVPLAEETGLILPLGRWLRAEACRQVRAWQARYPSDPPLHLSTNLSPREFRHPALAADVAGALHAAGLAPTSLTLEITENAAITDPDAAVATLRELRGLGVRLAVDDFGTGYASLSSLKRFPVDELKIDRAFVAGLGRDHEDTAIVRATVGVAKALGLGVTAEGVETAEQATALGEMGCDRGQGWFFAPSLPAEGLEALLKERAGLVGNVA